MMTATRTRETENPKYPGWMIQRTGPVAYLMTRPSGLFAVAVTHSEARGWEGEILTRQRGVWAPAKTPFTHSVLGCVAEADRREKAIAKYSSRPLTRTR